MYKVMLRRLRVTIVVIKNNDTFPLYSIFVGLHVACQQYKSVQCCHGNATLHSLCTVVEITFRTAVNHTEVLVVDLHVKCPSCLSEFNQIYSFSAGIRVSSDIKFQENPSSGS